MLSLENILLLKALLLKKSSFNTIIQCNYVWEELLILICHLIYCSEESYRSQHCQSLSTRLTFIFSGPLISGFTELYWTDVHNNLWVCSIIFASIRHRLVILFWLVNNNTWVFVCTKVLGFCSHSLPEFIVRVILQLVKMMMKNYYKSVNCELIYKDA